MADNDQNEDTDFLSLPPEIERRIVDWVADQQRACIVVRKDLIQWFAEALLRKNNDEIHDSKRKELISPEYIDNLVERFPELSRALKVPPHPTPRPSSPETDQNQGEPLRGSDFLRDIMRKKRKKVLYGDSPPAERRPAPYPEGQILYHCNNRYAVRHGDLITKYSTFDGGFGHFDRPNEAMVLEFIKEHTTIPVPKLISCDWDRVTMEYVEGRTLHQAWPILTADERTTILAELRGYIQQLRQLPGIALCQLDGQGVVVPSIMTRIGGPFRTIGEFHDWLSRPRHSGSKAETMYWHQITTQLANDVAIVFTHGDIAARNIIVRDGHIAAILDWEFAGWYPEYWEYVFALRGMDHVDWETLGYHLPSLFDKRFDLEYILMRFITSLS